MIEPLLFILFAIVCGLGAWALVLFADWLTKGVDE